MHSTNVTVLKGDTNIVKPALLCTSKHLSQWAGSSLVLLLHL